jgi:hypothetical protein
MVLLGQPTASSSCLRALEELIAMIQSQCSEQPMDAAFPVSALS